MIDFEHVTKVYETQNDENVALEDINIHIDEGEFVFILGHSGAGKSTFLKLIQMEEKPTEGKIYINDQDLTTIKRRKEIGIMKLVGATNGFIRFPFFVEGVTSCLLYTSPSPRDRG